MPPLRPCVAAALAGCAAALALCPPTASAAVGSSGIGDRYFPYAGNGGYQARHYDVALDINPGRNHVDAVVDIRATAKLRLSRFDLDYRGPALNRVLVDGRRAGVVRKGQELEITPAHTVRRGPFEVRVSYSGSPHPVTDPDGSTEGWVRTADGSVALGEPQGTPSWLPCNDHPTDKATYRFELTVPSTHVAVANGRLVSREPDGLDTTFTWHQAQPMASYLAVIDVGTAQFEKTSYAGIPAWNAIDPAVSPSTDLDVMNGILAFEGQTFGAYPFSATGAIVDPALPQISYALETQSRPFYPIAPGVDTLAHELAHQWYGDSVSVRRWREIWLNEGFATYAEWLYDAHTGGRTTAQRFASRYATPASDKGFWNPPPGDPGGPQNLFDETIYVRGAMTLEVLRQRIGDDAFFALLRRWAHARRYGTGSTAALHRMAERISGEELDGLFRRWLYEPGKPKLPGGQGARTRAGKTAPAPTPALR